jgi:predicted lipoprotein with Yx(FWY)xxD motif
MRMMISNPERAVLAVAAVAVLVAGCSDDDTDGSNSGGNGSSVVSVASVDGTDVLADADGHTLYTAEAEEDGKIRCVEACASFWEPVMASADDADEASRMPGDNFGVVDRPDGGSQLTYDGLPLYSFAEEDSGELQGDGFTDDFQGTHFVWEAARASGASAPAETPTPDDSGGGYAY